MLPTFLVIGAMKSGTTSLAEYLNAHPDGFVTPDKEPDFFTRPDRFELGVEWYESLFAEAGSALARGEASTSYTKFPRFRDTPQRIAATLPDVRLLYVVRHPIERIRSQYFHAVLRGKERRPLTEVLRAAPQYVDNSRYGLQIDHFLDHFPREQLLVLTSEQLRQDRLTTVARAYRFVGIEPDRTPEQVHQTFHETRDRPGARAFDQRLQAVPGRGLASRLAPTWLKSRYRQLASWGVEDVEALAHLSPDTVRRLEDDLRADVARVRDFLDDGFDGWGIA